MIMRRSCGGLHPLAGHKSALAWSRHHHCNAITAHGRLPDMVVEAFGLDDMARCRNAAARLRKDGLRGGTLGRVARAIF